MARRHRVSRWAALVTCVAAGAGLFVTEAATTAAAASCQGRSVQYRYRTFDAPGHVDTGLHGGNHHGAVTCYFDRCRHQ